MRILCLSRLLILVLALVAAPCLMAETPGDPADEALDIETVMSTPAVPAKHSAMVASAMGNLMRTLKQAGFNAESLRSGEVVTVTIPASSLFASNARELKGTGRGVLSRLIPYVKRTDNYKVVIAVHSDDTGDEEYAYELTEARAEAVDAYFASALAIDATPFAVFGLGADEPVASNSGVANRARNRRVEISFVPTQQYIDKLRKK